MEDLVLTNHPDRRVFIKGLGYVSTALLLGLFGGCEGCLEAIANRPTRRRLRVGSSEVDAVIATYKEAVGMMKGLPGGDPRSWSAQAALHGTVSGGFNFCQHGTDHFFSWHRAYLFYFEKICQELTGDDSFALPYWNWNQDPAMNPTFLDSASTLFHSRNNTTVAGSPAVSDSTLDTIFSDTNFFTFSAQLEGSPHNMVHVIVGGDMVTGGSPLDPIFWTHHCMVDYVWAKWNIELENDNPNDATWTDTTWNHFVDGSGDPATITAGSTVLMPLLSYQYESSVVGSSAAIAAFTTRSEFNEIEERLKKGADVRYVIRERFRIAERARVPLDKPLSRELSLSPDAYARLLDSDDAAERMFVSVEYAHLPPTNDFFVRVFLDHPVASPATSIEDPHYAGSFAFFGTRVEGSTGHHHAPRFLVDIGPSIRRLRRTGELTGGSSISVQLVAVPLGPEPLAPDAELALEGLDIIVTPIIVKGKRSRN